MEPRAVVEEIKAAAWSSRRRGLPTGIKWEGQLPPTDAKIHWSATQIIRAGTFKDVCPDG